MSNALTYAKLVQIAGTTEGKYSNVQWDAAKALGYNITQEIWGGVGEHVSFGFVANSAQETVIAFRGTAIEKLLEWVEAANCDLASFGPGKRVHEGFYSVYESLDIDDISPRKVILCGHSLGAALATLLALDSDFSTQAVYTFGSPRVGDTAFVTVYDRTIPQTFRYVNRYDIVPSLPPSNLGYKHVGTEFRLNGPFELDLAKNHELTSGYLTNLAGAELYEQKGA
jgi:triacylglycerol lipase